MRVEGDTGGEMQAHLKTYSLFNTLMKWGTIISFVLAMFVVFVLIV